MESIGIRELKENLSRYMKRIKAGERIIITDRKKEIAVISPIETADTEEKVVQMVRKGKATWAGGKPGNIPRRIVLKGGNVSDAVIEDRR